MGRISQKAENIQAKYVLWDGIEISLFTRVRRNVLVRYIIPI